MTEPAAGPFPYQTHPGLDNIVENGRGCASFVDPFTQKGVKLTGLATAIAPGDRAFETVAAPLRAVAGPRFPIAAVFVIEVSAVAPILAPSYLLFPETTEAMQVAAAMRTYGVQAADGDDRAAPGRSA